MKLHQKQNRGGVVLLVIVTIGIIVAGLVLYNLYKWARSVSSGAPVINRGFTNDDEFVTPHGDITALEFRDAEMWFEWWDEVSASPIIVTSTVPAWEVLGWLSDGENMELAIRPSGNPQRHTWAEIGVPVDEYGIPCDLSWSLGSIPSGETWTLERSTNLLDWEYVTDWIVSPGLTNVCPVEGPAFFRAKGALK